MKRTPTSMMDFLKTVQCVEHPDLKLQHRHFLSIVALSADYDTGRNSHPGFAAIAKAMGRSEESVRLYARHCEDLGLIQVTRKPDGKTIATTWRVCLEHPGFVDLKALDLNALGPKNGGDRSKDGSGKVQRFAAIGPNLGLDLPSDTHTPTHNPTPSATKPVAGEGGVREKPVGHGRDIKAEVDETVRAMNKLYMATEEKIMMLRKEDKTNLRRLVMERPGEEILAAFTEARSQGIWQGLRFPLYAFFDGYDALVDAAKRKSARKPMTDDEIKLAGERSLALRNKIFDTVSSDDEPGGDLF